MERPFFSRRLGIGMVAIGLLSALFFASAAPVLAQSLGGGPFDEPTITDKIPTAPGLPVSVVSNVTEQINSVYQNIRWELIGAGTMAFMNAMQTFFGQLAYDAADYLASGGKGQSALYYQKGFQDYFKDVAGSAAGEFIGSLSQSSFFQTVGFDLCRPPDPQTLLRIQLSLGQFLPSGSSGSFQRPQARCDFNDVVNNYEQVYQTLSNTDVLKSVEANLNTNANDLGVSFLIFNRAQEFVSHTQSTSEKDRAEGGGYQALRDIVSGRIRTPAETIREQANQVLVKDPKANQEQINSFILNQAWQLGPSRLAMYTASVFLNTFASRMISRVLQEGIGIFDVFGTKTFNIAGSADDLLQGNRNDARQANINLRTPNLFRDVSYDVLSEMQACPENRGTWNCTIDEGLGQALRSQGDSGTFTIREALDNNFLREDWRLFSSNNVREERDPLCYTYGYCQGNLRKLRLMRILPAGFEFAANDPINIQRCGSGQGCVTLGEVVNGFTDCNAQGKKDDAHPWCKLIDPNWALTALPQQCALSGYGDVMLSNDLSQRREQCQDVQTCLQRNDKGECVGGYGYCVAEKAAYRFGAQECSPTFASCRTYATREGGSQVSYLRNTLNYGNCSEDNVGCLWYATSRDPAATRSNAWVGTPSSGPRVYFDKTMEACDASGEGCTRLLAVRPGEKSLNLIPNASFEQVGSSGSALEVWKPLVGTSAAYIRPLVTGGEPAADGSLTANFAGGFAGGYRQVVDLEAGHTYVLSGFVRALATGRSNALIALRQYPSRESAEARTGALDPALVRRNFMRAGDCVQISSASGLGALGDAATGAVGLNAALTINSQTWVRAECTFTVDQNANAGEIIVGGTNALADAIQLEEGSVATQYINGLAPGLEEVFHKVAPTELACTGTSTDSPLCANYAQVCRQSEASCNGYTDVNSAFPEVAAQVNPNDLCPASCVGYQEYRKLASSFDLVQSSVPELNDATEPRSSYFIPSTAEQCTQEAVGCSEFTVLDGTAAGGENREYFNSLRFCEKPADDTDTYFTWEGSDSAGYQLRTWSLKKRTDAKPGAVPPEGGSVVAASGPRIVVQRSGDLFSQKNPLDCDDANWRTGSDADCRQFYNAAGNVFYRYYSQTVLSSPDCRSIRKADSSEDDCRKTGGEYRAQERACIYQAYAPESGSCTANFAGCRAYAGAEGGNLLTVFSANGTNATAVSGARVSSESLLVGDQSYRADIAAGGRTNLSIITSSTAGSLYRVSFWAKASASSTVVVNALRPSGEDVRVVGTLRLTTDWQRVSFGTFDGAAGNRTVLSWTVSAAPGAPVAFFLDEINVQQLRDVVFVKQNSWQTPNECNQNAYGVPEPQAMAGCREYRDRDGQTVNARQFSQLCRPAAIGCREFVDTRNSVDPYAQTFSLAEGSGSSVTRRSADRFIYLIDDQTKRCDAANASCRAFGKPVFSSDRLAVERFDTVYLKDDVTKYSEGLCRPSELFCEEFTTNAGREYFKDPQNHACEYREQVSVTSVAGVPDGSYNGWFIKGTSAPCYPDALSSGQQFQILRTGDASPGAGYQGWGGVCPQEQTECTEFRDPADKTTTSNTGRAYYFINNEQIDTRSCNGTIDPARGCVPLRNMSDARLLYSTEATLQQYQANNLQAVTPVDCQANPTQAGCTAVRTGRCVAARVTQRYAETFSGTGSSRVPTGIVLQETATTTFAGGSCSQDSDCAAETAPRFSGRNFSQTVLSGILDGTRIETVPEYQTTFANVRCDRPSLNDANAIVKVKIDRDCAQWLGCATGETVYDPSTNRYHEVCTKVALCDRPGEQGGSANYCSNYVNRTTTSTEPVLTAGAYFDAKQYTSRAVGVSARDYSGYSIPNAFQVVDLQSRPVEGDVAGTGVVASDERRLVVAVKMPPMQRTGVNYTHTVPPTRPTQAQIIPRTDPSYSSVPSGTLLCQHRGTGLIGYFLPDEALQAGQEINCYFAFHGSADVSQFVGLNNRLSAGGVSQDLVVDQAYPRALCRAYPEADAPFSDIVTSWNMSSNPIRASELRSGYENANTCAFGEDCSCSYKRVEYPGLTKPLFFDADSQAVPPGVCVGGPRNGQACLPSEVFNISSSTSTSAKIAEAANNNQTCGAPGSGGNCVAFSKAEIVRGVVGSCLEYDTTHARGTPGSESYSCLAWNPSPIVGGKDDSYRYIETAGYFPPQNSGQYYCTSKARAPKSFTLSESDFSLLPSGVNKLGYNDALVSDGTSLGGGNNRGAYFEGLSPLGSNAASQCEDADDDQDDDGPFNYDAQGLRIVATGRGEGQNYTETFYGLRPEAIAALTYNGSSPERTSTVQRNQALQEQNMSYIEIRPFLNPNGNGRLACGYQEDWVDGVHVDDYDDLDKTGPADRQWRSAFFAESDLSTYLTRGSEQVLTNDTDRPLKMPCVRLGDGTSTGDAAEEVAGSECYFKTWEVGYRSADQKKFVGFGRNTGEFASRERTADGFSGLLSPVYETCDAEKPYYAIRAVFQTTAATQSLPSDRITPRDVRGPWRLMGFWVSSCAGKSTTDNRAIYMNVRFQTADICRDLAEVRSSKTSQDAAFTDRVWQDSKYSVPILGIEYGESYAPFSSALNTGVAGEDPLYQTGGKLAGSSSIRQPIFLASGYSTYFGPLTPGTPKDRYAYLSNLFARIYRVYHYNEQRIDTTDRVCVAGQNIGRKCVPDAPPGSDIPASGHSIDCRALSAAASCNTAEPPPTTLKVCNALSGINAGKVCGSQPESCHSYPLDPRPTARTARPLVTACRRQEGWTKQDDGTYRRAGETRSYNQHDAAGNHAFRCAPGAVKLRDGQVSTADPIGLGTATDTVGVVGLRYAGRPITGLSGATLRSTEGPTGPTSIPDDQTVYCTQEADVSEECPMEVVGSCIKPPGSTARTQGTCQASWLGQPSISLPAVSCYQDTDCSFNASNFWRNPTTARFPEGAVGSLYAFGNDFDGRWGIVASSRSVAASATGAGTISRCGTGCRIDTSTVGYTSTLFSSTLMATDPTLVTEQQRFPGAIATNSGGTFSRPIVCNDLPTEDERVACRRGDPGTTSVATPVSGYLIGGCEPVTDLVRGAGSEVQVGTCSEGTAGAGSLCLATGSGASFPYQQWASPATTCAGTPPAAGDDYCRPVSNAAAGSRLIPTNAVGTADEPGLDCRLPGDTASASQTKEEYWGGLSATQQAALGGTLTMNSDNNSCTAEVGYQPDRRLCPDPSNEFCGLIAYDMRAATGDRRSIDKRVTTIPLPTDVTLGLYTPSYLGLPTSAVSEAAYEYIDYYTPRPPRIAAPPASCPAGTNCGVQDLDRFSFNGITQGILNVVGGQYRSTIKFFGWAAHEQMAIRHLSVDWGDGTVQDFNDVKLKNHKPYCSVQKECYSPSDGFTGLTCQADNDCPITAQACRTMGSCKDKKNLVCAQDSDCRRDGSNDSCSLRAFFGNSAEACEASPFEFSHVYACPAGAASTLPRCSGQNYVTDVTAVPPPSDVIAPAPGRSGTCYFGGADSFAIEGRTRPTCTASGAAGQAECRAIYGAIIGVSDTSRPSASIPDVVFNAISCGPQATPATPVLRDGTSSEGVVTQGRCSGDTTRFCRASTDCAAGDQCISVGLAPPTGCWDDQNNACRFTPRVFVQDNWGWCTGECRAQTSGGTLQDSASSPIQHPYGGCYTPTSLGADVQTQSTRFNTQSRVDDTVPNQLIRWGDTGAAGLECAIDRPNGAFTSTGTDARRNFRPWIVFPGSVQLRPKN